jgi:hypothetical protein
MAVNDSLVRDEAQDACNQNPEGYLTIRVAKALGVVISKRQWNGGSVDNESLAAADHYLNMRLLTSFSVALFPLGTVLIGGYDLLKATLPYLPEEITSLFQETKAPLTAPTPRVREWAFRGLKDGCSDFPGMWRGGVIRVPWEP